MTSFLQPYLPQIRSLCQQMGVKELYLVGSAARGTDFTEESDVDFLYQFISGDDGMPVHPESDYFTMQSALEDILGRKVDLIANGTITNPYVKATMEEDKTFLYAA